MTVETNELVFTNFKRHWPSLAAKTSDWRPYGYLSIVACTNEGPYVYCDLDNTVRKLVVEDDTGVNDDIRMEEFGHNLRERMIAAGVGQIELSDATGISKQMLSRYMNGKSSPTFLNVIRIARVLKCSVEDFLDASKLSK